MRRKIVMYPMYEETLVVESLMFESIENGVDYTHHYTLKTPAAGAWSLPGLLRELADRIDRDE
jgi:hypothetical protein